MSSTSDGTLELVPVLVYENKCFTMVHIHHLFLGKLINSDNGLSHPKHLLRT